MVWKYGDVYLKAGTSWTETNGTMHPAQWMRWTDAEKKTKGLTWEDPSPSVEPVDTKFYWGRNSDGSLIERKLADENRVDDDGNAINDPITGKQLVISGLKSVWIAKTKETANSLLSKTDWYVTRKAEASTAIPSDISTYRTDVRTASKTIEDKINGCADLNAFKALFDVPKDSNDNPTGNAPIYDFPDEI